MQVKKIKIIKVSLERRKMLAARYELRQAGTSCQVQRIHSPTFL